MIVVKQKRLVTRQSFFVVYVLITNQSLIGSEKVGATTFFEIFNSLHVHICGYINTPKRFRADLSGP